MLSSLLLAAAFVLGLRVHTVLGFIECSVLDYGAVADNSTDLGPALTRAWQECVIPQVTTTVATDVLLYVPAGDYLLASTVTFDDAENWNLHIAGNVYLPFDPDLTGTMLTFENCDNILFNGPGAIFGNGYRYREGGDLSLFPNRPRLIRFQTCNKYESLFSLYIHIQINVAHDMSIVASHIGLFLAYETDGFDVSGNNNYVHDVSVEVDECVTVKTPTNGFLAERITCKFTAGCNIGSFGSGATGVDVQNVFYSDVTISNSDAGVMIKSYPNCQGTVKNVTYTGFTLGGTDDTGTLEISDVTYENFVGSGTPTRPGVLLDCNEATPCQNIAFSGISLTNTIADQFTNACGTGLSGLDGC
ncbi:pectin lyase-like protein [Lentinula raphanica]|nr:pectin lyase-like protein [Lentinula raphanica]